MELRKTDARSGHGSIAGVHITVAEIQKYRNVEIQKYRNPEIQKYRNTEIQKYRNTEHLLE